MEYETIFFHDWRHVSHGAPAWETAEGERPDIWGEGPLPDLRWRGSDIPTGVRLRAMPAEKSGPLVRGDKPWEGMLFHATLMLRDGLYRLWYEAVHPDDLAHHHDLAGSRNQVCYAESDDALNWRKPDLDVAADHYGRKTNVVYGGPLSPTWGYHGGSIFVDPSCLPEERFKAFHLGMIPENAKEFLDRYREKHSQEIDPYVEDNIKSRGRCNMMFGAVSPDGIRWKPLPEPLVAQYSDTQNIAYYDESLKKYVGYFRTRVRGRRAIGRAETDDFRHFPLPQTILWPSAEVGPSDTWYGNGKNLYPGTTHYHLLFAKRWNVGEDRFYVHLATSPDGILWGLPPESQVLSPGERGSWDTGSVSIGCGMVPLPGDRVGVPFLGYRVPHKHPRRAPLGEIGIASWQKGRLVALEADEQGSFRVGGFQSDGNELHMNVRTSYAGEVRVEVIGARGNDLPGRTFQDCDPINGDSLDKTVTWRGESQIPCNPNQPLSFRVQMSSAQLFSMNFA